MGIRSFADVPKLRHIQLVSAGADKAVKQEIMREIHGLRESGREITLGSASGIHVLSIPPWVVGQAVALWQQFPKMLSIQRVSRIDWCTIAPELNVVGRKEVVIWR